MSLARLIYVSEPQLDPAKGSILTQIASIMSSSRRNNKAADITGALVYDESWFLQVLEGDRRAIWETFARINEDERHAGCLLVEMTEAPDRLFRNWWMGLATRDAMTAPAFKPYLVGDVLRADVMSARDILALMSGLAKLGLRREMRSAA